MYSILMLKLIKSVLVEQVKKAETALRKANNEKEHEMRHLQRETG